MKAFKETIVAAKEKIMSKISFTDEELHIASNMLEASCTKQSADKQLDDLINMYENDKDNENMVSEFVKYVDEIYRIAFKNRIIKYAKSFVRPALNLAYELFLLALEIFAWIVIPVSAFAFVSYFVPFLGTDTHGQIATIAAYAVAAVGGIRGAMSASTLIRSFRVKW